MTRLSNPWHAEPAPAASIVPAEARDADSRADSTVRRMFIGAFALAALLTALVALTVFALVQQRIAELRTHFHAERGALITGIARLEAGHRQLVLRHERRWPSPDPVHAAEPIGLADVASQAPDAATATLATPNGFAHHQALRALHALADDLGSDDASLRRLYDHRFRFVAVHPPLDLDALRAAQSLDTQAFIARTALAVRAALPFLSDTVAAGGGATWLPPHVDPLSRRPVVGFAHPVFQGERVFAVSTELYPLDGLAHALLARELAPGFTLLSRDGTRLAGRALPQAFASAEIARRTAPAFASGNRPALLRIGSALAMVQAVPGPDWLLVYPLGWATLLWHGYFPPASPLYAAMLGIALLMLLWWIVWRVGARTVPVAWPTALPAGFCVLDRVSGRALHANAAARAYRHAGAPAADFFVGLRDAHRRRPNDTLELVALGPARRRVHLLATCLSAPYHGRDALWCVLTDVTRLKLTESRLRALERTSRTRGASQARFLAIASHEIRTPLHGALGHLELLSSAEMSAAQRELLATARQALCMLSRRVEDMLDASIAASGQLRLARHAFDPAGVVEAAARAVASLARQRGQRLRCEIAPGLPPRIYGDATRLRQILDNLLANAMKFTDGGEIVLRLRTMPRPPDGQWLAFDVEDTGIGIAPEHQLRLFRPFSQAHPGIAPAYGGTGIGLALCRQLCERMGGHLSLASAPGRGSRFTLALPCDAAAPPRVPALADVPPSVLVIEDDDICRRLLVRQLTLAGCTRIDGVIDGDEAVRQCRRHRYDVVLMDWQLPGLSGAALAAAIRGYAPDIRIVAVTADASVRHTAAPGCVDDADGIDDVLRKPLGLDALRAALARPNARRRRIAHRDTALVDDFLRSYGEDIAALRDRWARSEFGSVLTGLHRLKGALLMLGAEGPAALNEAVADALRASDIALATQRFAAFEAAMSFHVASAATSDVAAPPAR